MPNFKLLPAETLSTGAITAIIALTCNGTALQAAPPSAPFVPQDAVFFSEKNDTDVNAGAKKSAFAMRWENDFQWSDKYYTNANKLAYTTAEIAQDSALASAIAKVTPLANADEHADAGYRYHFGLSHEIYAPREKFMVNPPLDDHPYTGLFYATFGVSSETSSQLDSVEVSLGILGKYAFGEDVQNNWHRFINDPIALGWDTQLHNEPLLQAAWERHWRFSLYTENSLGIDFIPRIHAEIGTVRSYGTAGVQMRAGWHLPENFGTQLLRASTGTTRPDRAGNYGTAAGWKPDSFHVFGDLQGEGWLWNSTLDGNIWRNSRDVEKYPFVMQMSFGVETRFGAWKLALAEVFRSKEFKAQDHDFFIFHSLLLEIVF